jgi:hypothetical protein
MQLDELENQIDTQNVLEFKKKTIIDILLEKIEELENRVDELEERIQELEG